jgi:leucyl-tRNA synthetase
MARNRRRKVNPETIQLAKDLRKNMTKAETVLWERLRRKQLGMPVRRQAVVWGYIADFYIPSVSLIIEVDGSIHQHQTEYDATRTKHLEAKGFTVIRFTNNEVINSTDDVVTRIKSFCTRDR